MIHHVRNKQCRLPIGVHIGYCHCIHNTWINCSTTTMEKCSFTASPVGTSPHVLTGYFEKQKVLLYMSQDDTTGTVLYLLRGSVKDQTMWVILMSHAPAGEKAYLWWVTECTYGARTRVYGGSHKFHTIFTTKKLSKNTSHNFSFKQAKHFEGQMFLVSPWWGSDGT